MLQTCRVDADHMREAVDTNCNLGPMGIDRVAVPYRFYGQDPTGPEPVVPWKEGLVGLRATAPVPRLGPDPRDPRRVHGRPAHSPLRQRMDARTGLDSAAVAVDRRRNSARSGARNLRRCRPFTVHHHIRRPTAHAADRSWNLTRRSGNNTATKTARPRPVIAPEERG
ncbi:hypothetical protein GCM10018790_81090 [Kitasatospora xanthocidica]|nr:hypothetical protein GCM10018790_81090 [Kitasatospora xanthocidica]